MEPRQLNALTAVAMLSAGAFWIGFTLTGHVVVLPLGAIAYAAGTGFFVAYVDTVIGETLSSVSFEVSVDESISRHA